MDELHLKRLELELDHTDHVEGCDLDRRHCCAAGGAMFVVQFLPPTFWSC